MATQLAETYRVMVGAEHREDPVAPVSGSPSGNARLTAWAGFTLLALFAVQGLTLLSLGGLMSVHLFVGGVLIPLVLLKTAATGWRVVRYYSRHDQYVEAGPPPLLLRLLGPLVVIGGLAVLGTGVALAYLGRSSYDTLGSLLGFRFNTITLHQAAALFWIAVTGPHILTRLVPALRIASPTDPNRRVPGTALRFGVIGLTAVAGASMGFLVLHAGHDWTSHLADRPYQSQQ